MDKIEELKKSWGSKPPKQYEKYMYENFPNVVEALSHAVSCAPCNPLCSTIGGYDALHKNCWRGDVKKIIEGGAG